MSAASNALTVVTLVAGISTFASHTPLDMMPGVGEGFKFGIFAAGAGATMAFRVIEDY